MERIDSLLLLPHEQLTLANAHEAAELQRYRRLALCFLPQAPQTSRLMATLGMQCEKRLDLLHKTAVDLELEACVGEMPPASSRNNIAQRHFFIVDAGMGGQVLEQTVNAAIESKTFFEWLLNTNATPELHQPLLNFVREKEGECRVLLEHREQHREPLLARRA